jgi:cytochrome P450
MLEMITEHKHTDIVSKHDLLSSLINANNNEREDDGLTDSELMGNSLLTFECQIDVDS